MRNLKSSSSVELVTTSHLAFGHENESRVQWALLYCCSMYFWWNVLYTFQWYHVNSYAGMLLPKKGSTSCDEIMEFYLNIPVWKSDLKEGKGTQKSWASVKWEGIGCWESLLCLGTVYNCLCGDSCKLLQIEEVPCDLIHVLGGSCHQRI